MKNAFTLMELLIVVLIIGILATMAMPLYRKTIETSKATNAASIANMIANANRMYQLDNNIYATGQITDSCNYAICPSAKTGNACELVACGYLSKQQWSAYQWIFCACNGSHCGGCPAGCSGANSLACASNNRTPLGSPYNTWRYEINSLGQCVSFGSKVPDCPTL